MVCFSLKRHLQINTEYVEAKGPAISRYRDRDIEDYSQSQVVFQDCSELGTKFMTRANVYGGMAGDQNAAYPLGGNARRRSKVTKDSRTAPFAVSRRRRGEPTHRQ